eukprot:CAMPEP_0197688260 /NCGR_PEP_ID=MMETSP1338-20131121/105168_1 /TAXON_ID=43686 ORGANISM="Pelagodinium beii, Strain RCC1491" /NCGR_SAMPLE_ID=MMETSP1338 /ASSEMBLY_ACC=CAM_ASM_000754 /LENGTH=146 /DNA_ID=CAMNT_0043270453 /DNA_START=415 /DNA_END=855 /DNA_ORIENTATION=+
MCPDLFAVRVQFQMISAEEKLHGKRCIEPKGRPQRHRMLWHSVWQREISSQLSRQRARALGSFTPCGGFQALLLTLACSNSLFKALQLPLTLKLFTIFVPVAIVCTRNAFLIFLLWWDAGNLLEERDKEAASVVIVWQNSDAFAQF